MAFKCGGKLYTLPLTFCNLCYHDILQSFDGGNTPSDFIHRLLFWMILVCIFYLKYVSLIFLYLVCIIPSFFLVVNLKRNNINTLHDKLLLSSFQFYNVFISLKFKQRKSFSLVLSEMVPSL